jgi:hypothetical protein
MSFARKWVELEAIMLSEISQFHKDSYHILFSPLWKLRREKTREMEG